MRMLDAPKRNLACFDGRQNIGGENVKSLLGGGVFT